jgi:Leucine-rich repeat (LRR) protein
MSDIEIIRQMEAKLGITLKQVTPEAITQKEDLGYLKGLRAYALDEQGRVRGLSLDYLYAVSDVIGYFQHLQQMTFLSLRGYNDEDYTFLAKLIQLTTLDLCKTEVSDLTVLKDLKNLTTLDLSFIKVRDHTILKDLKNLTTLNLHRTPVSDLTVLKDLKNLTTLILWNTKVSDLTVLKDLKNLTTLNLWNTEVSDLTVLKDLKNLTTLNLHRTPVSDLTVLKDLKNLTTLVLRVTPVSDLTVLKDLKNLTTLNLHRTPVSDLTVLKDLKNLTTLILWNTKVSDLTVLKDLKNLTTLNLWNTEVSDLTVLKDLKNLTTLNLGGTPVSDLTVLKDLKNLTTLNLWNTKVSDLTVLKDLKNLTTLDLSETKVSDLTVLKDLKNLTTLNLWNTEVSDLTVLKDLKNLTTLDLWNTKVNDFTALKDLKNLAELYLIDTPLSELIVLKDLKNLTTLDLRGTQVSDFTVLKDLKNLTTLVLSKTPISELMVLKDLKNLTTLVLNETNVNDLSPIVDLPSLYQLSIIPERITNPPPEIAAQGLPSIRNYFRQLAAQGEEKLYEAKMLIVGEGGAGKTTLAKKIIDPSYELDNNETSTEGIEVLEWRFETPDHHSFRANIWDFSGQEIYHATHQFFLSKRSLYLLVADTRKEDTDFFYWLNVVELLSDNSPLLIIKNEKQDRHRDINERQLRSRFMNLKETVATNLANNRGLEKVLAEIQHQLCQLPHIGTALPKTWVKVREALERDSRNLIPLNEYFEICARHGFTITADKLQLSGYLHDLGVYLHFQDDPLLRKIVILKPKWGTDAVYRVLDNKQVTRNLGKFFRADLENIWTEPEYAEMLDELLQLMIKFKLCYRLPSSPDQYIAPQLLSENQLEYDWNSADNLHLRYKYEFMPKGILTQFIVMTHTMILGENCVWKSGVVLVKDNTFSEVIEDYHNREIKIRVSGKHKRDLMAIVTYELERIHSSFSQLKCSKHIPCNCLECQAAGQPNFYPFEDLQRFIEDQKDIQCRISYQMVNPRRLIDDISGGTGFDKVRQRDQVFISYSHKDRIWLEKLLTMLKPLTRDQKLSLWADTEIRAGDRWREEIRQALDSAKVAVLLVSPNFLASDFIAENELPPILKAARDRELVILWVPISDCLYRVTAIADYQAAMEPSNPLDSLGEAGANKALVGICEKISAAMNG